MLILTAFEALETTHRIVTSMRILNKLFREQFI